MSCAGCVACDVEMVDRVFAGQGIAFVDLYGELRPNGRIVSRGLGETFVPDGSSESEARFLPNLGAGTNAWI